MRRALLDVNVLLALLDADHAQHDLATTWLDAEVGGGWATCAITQNGFVRVISQPRYASPVPVAAAAAALARACAEDAHQLWACDVSLVDPAIADVSRLLGPRQVTDTYLLALAVAHGGRLVTFDERVTLAAVVGASEDHLTVL